MDTIWGLHATLTRTRSRTSPPIASDAATFWGVWPALLLMSCTPEPGPGDSGLPADPLVVQLRWVGGGLLGWEEAQDGLWWSLSSLGALPPAEPPLTIVEDRGDAVVFRLDLGAVGFPEAALPAVEEAVAELREAPSLARHGGVDVGRFLMRTLHEPWRYYAITGACEQMADWQAARQADHIETYAVTESILVEGDRLIEVNQGADDVRAIGFRSAEFVGGLDDAEVGEHEVIDVMPNGRQRYAVYGADGWLVAASDPAVSPAGQPGRCLWCHEGTLMLGAPNPPVEGYWTYEAFAASLADQVAVLEAHRATLETAVAFDAVRDVHAWGELLVEEFLHPTPARVALEWGISEGAVRLMGLSAQDNAEYPELGPVYTRAAVDALLREREGWRPIETLDSGRELHPADPRLAPATLRACDGVR